MSGVSQKTVNLLSPLKSGPFNFKNRVVQAAMTRQRTTVDGVPNELNVQYYSRRSKYFGLVLTECSGVALNGNAFPGATSIYGQEHVDGWKKVIEQVKKNDGTLFLQIWHGGRAAHPNHFGGKETWAPSPIAIKADVFTPKGKEPHAVPKEMTKEDIKTMVGYFRKGAENAKVAGFDGIELHASFGYLIDEFLRDSANKRTDEYGGSIENRMRFPLQVVDQLIEVFGAKKVGVKISPQVPYNDMSDSNPLELFTNFVGELSKRKILFVENLDFPYGKGSLHEKLRPKFNGLWIANGGFNYETGNKIIQDGNADMVSFGTLAVANEDLPLKFKNNTKLWGVEYSKPEDKLRLMYGPGPIAEGYTDLKPFEPK